MTGLRPSERLRAFLDGHAPTNDAPQEWLSFIIYRSACAVLQEHDKDSRRRALARVPRPIRGLVEDEVRRLWNKRRGQ